ncbi:MAG TPA: hypothetical protein VHF25_02020, partial [Nitriliruptorales bacterium]|nr:hypothetical protein [Nitriliruptorales bacterium]
MIIPVLVWASVMFNLPMADAQESVSAELSDHIAARIQSGEVSRRDGTRTSQSSKPYTIEVPSDMFPGRWCLKDKTVRGRVWIIEVNPVTGEQRRIREEERCLPW